MNKALHLTAIPMSFIATGDFLLGGLFYILNI